MNRAQKDAVQEFSGIDHLSATANAAMCAIIAFGAYFVVPTAIGAYVIAVAVVAVPLAVATRYRLRISIDGIEWALLLAWVFPTGRQRYLLDANIEFYESLEATKPEGVYIHPLRVGGDEKESPCFGPSFSQTAMTALRDRSTQAIRHARDLLPPTPPDLRCPPLAKDIAQLDVHGAKRNWQNRRREVRTLGHVAVGGTSLPPGTLLELNHDDYIDPRRPDLLVAAVVNTPLRLPIGVDVPAGTRLALRPSGELWVLCGALGLIELDGFSIDGNECVGIDADGHVGSFTLGSETRLNGWLLAPGTTFSSWPKMSHRPAAWHCTLSAVLQLPELDLRPGDSVDFDKASKTLVAIYPRSELTIDGVRLLHAAIPVFPDGRIDKKRARKLGVLQC